MRRAGQAGRGTRARRIKEDTFSERNEALLVRRKQICLFISFGLPKVNYYRKAPRGVIKIVVTLPSVA